MVAGFDFSVQFYILPTMGILCLLLSYLFYKKSRSLAGLSGNARVTIYNKTFGIMDVETERKRVSHINITLMFILFVLMYFFVWVAIVRVTPYLLGLAIVVSCVGLMMLYDALDIYKGANIFVRALENKAEFARGDLAAMSFVNRTLPKFIKYYLLLAIVFFASFAVAPLITSAAVTFVAGLGAMSNAFTASLGMLGFFLGVLTVALITLILMISGEIVKVRVFGFRSSVPLTATDEQFERLLIMSKWGEKPPFELSHRPVFEDYETEERKRKTLSEKE